jgi:hypothetical protein
MSDLVFPIYCPPSTDQLIHCHPYCPDLRLELVRETHHLQIKKKKRNLNSLTSLWLLQISSMNATLIVLIYAHLYPITVRRSGPLGLWGPSGASLSAVAYYMLCISISDCLLVLIVFLQIYNSS